MPGRTFLLQSGTNLQMNRLILTYLLALLMNAGASAQTKDDNSAFKHMDLGVNLGTTGIGAELAMPAGKVLRLRTGFSYMPRIEVPMTFGVQVGQDPAKSREKFNRLSNALNNFTGQEVKDEVYTLGRPQFWNWNVLVDVYPLKNNRHWHVTAGFYLGPSHIAEAFNKTESMGTLVAMNIFNNIHQRVVNSPVLNDEDYFFDHTAIEVLKDIKFLSDLGFINFKKLPPQLEDLYFDPEDNVVKSGYQNIANYGRMGVYIGTYSHDITDSDGNVIHQKGEPYMIEPDENSMVKTDMTVNALKPYVGIGYDGRLVSNNDRLTIGFDAGLMFWGGTPSLITHDGTDLIHDVDNVPGKVGDYVRMIKRAKVFPMVNLRLAFRLF